MRTFTAIAKTTLGMSQLSWTLVLALAIELVESSGALQSLNIISLWDEIKRSNSDSARNLCPTLLEKYVKCPSKWEPTLICVEYCFGTNFKEPTRMEMSWAADITELDTSDSTMTRLLRKRICSNYHKSMSCINDVVYNCKDKDRGPVHIMNALYLFGVGNICYDDSHFQAYLEWTDCYEQNIDYVYECVREYVDNLNDTLMNFRGNEAACRTATDVITCMKRILLRKGCIYRSSLASNEQFLDTFLLGHLESPFIMGCLHTRISDSLRKFGLNIPVIVSSSPAQMSCRICLFSQLLIISIFSILSPKTGF